MIKIHSFYSDLLLSLRYLFDNIVFTPGTIKTYEFNIGSRTLQLEYKSQYELPACQINYQDSNPNTYHPWLILRDGIGNPSRFPILYNKTKNLTLELQEEMYDINVMVTFNFESQFSAIEAEHRLKSNMPLNKPLQVYHFYTFYEIPDRFLEPEIFDVNNDQIVNLYMKHDPLTDRVIHCASVRYEPLIVLESCQSSLSNSEPRSFSVECGFRFMQSVPMYMEIPVHERPKIRDASEIVERNVAVPTIENIPILKLIMNLVNDEKIKLYIPIYPQDGKFSQEFVFSHGNKNYTGIVSGSLSGVSQSIGSLKVTVGDMKEDVECTYQLVSQKTPPVESLTVTGPLEGYITNFKMEGGRLTGMMCGTFNNTNFDTESFVNYRIDGEYTTVSSVHMIDKNPQLDIQDFPTIYNYSANTIIFGPIHSNMPHINTNRVSFDPEKSKIVGALIVERDTKRSFTTTATDSLDKYGNFNVTIDHKHSVKKNNIYASVKGKVHPKTMYLRYDFVDEQSDCDIEIVALIFDFNFRTVPKYGGQLIERIDLDINVDSFEPIAVAINSRFFKDEFNRLQRENDKTTIRSFVLSPTVSDHNIFVVDDKVKLSVTFDKNEDVSHIHDSIQNIEWKFMFNNEFYEHTGKLIRLLPPSDKIPPNVLEFEIDKDLYEHELKHFSVSNPIFFQLYEKF